MIFLNFIGFKYIVNITIHIFNLKTMKKKNIAVFTAGRSDFGILKNLATKIEKSKFFNLFIIVGPAHQSKVFGNTKNEILKNKFNKIYYIKNYSYNLKDQNTSLLISNIIHKTSILFKRKKIDAAIILGDRYEMFAFAVTCMNFKIPIIHLGGGSITLGSQDDIYRNSISLMSSLHLVETKHHKKNLNLNGIKKNINIIGAPALENLKKIQNKQIKSNIDKYIDKNKINIIVCFHPETNQSKLYNIKNLKVMIKFLNKINQNIIFTYPNADEGYLDFIKIINRNLRKKNSHIIQSFGIKLYHELLSCSDLLVGNSSSGIIESCSFNIPFINLGNRQKGRFAPMNVINSSFNINKISKAYNLALSNKFIKKISRIKNPYENKNSSDKALNHIINYLIRK